MTIDEAISYEKRNIEINELMGKISDCEPTNAIDYHRQLVEWLKELKQLREQEPKTGHWIKTKEQDDAEPFILWECSECLTVQRLKTNYCPNCGAKMAESEEI